MRIYCIKDPEGKVMLENGYFALSQEKLYQSNPPRIWLTEESAKEEMTRRLERELDDFSNCEGPMISKEGPKFRNTVIAEFDESIIWRTIPYWIEGEG